ncbi:MAG: 5-formyltetrahydrofolate cyclo-ligase [Lachnospiraceae bacterium]|nr:5-formyltetrahydrofolate cyclo-ligase [Lachnospiraceae bacterium]
MKSKAELRRKAAALRRAMTVEERKKASARIAERLFSLKEWREASSVFLYYGCSDEVSTESIIDRGLADGKEVMLPKVISEEEMVFINISSRDDLITGAYGIPEPKDNGSYAYGADLLVIPCVGIDIKGNRIGHGKGYYDRYLDRLSGITKICLAFETQIVEEFEADITDVKIEKVITEKRVIEV